jgi:hypothetical protein
MDPPQEPVGVLTQTEVTFNPNFMNIWWTMTDTRFKNWVCIHNKTIVVILYQSL